SEWTTRSIEPTIKLGHLDGDSSLLISDLVSVNIYVNSAMSSLLATVSHKKYQLFYTKKNSMT
ncbi:hypothetical protein, partial [Enterobacter hormaechei]|uniref:hypothetical protein n=1 Tax=Enterobacter hormaechei TaxID=158836 RepID=UPI001C3EB81D